jgi:hypothetical protein
MPEPVATLKDYPFKISYDAVDDRLHDFFLPALERSVRYHRSTGFFSSGALAQAATGIVRLIQNGGTMRILCGAQLSVEDVEALRKGASLTGKVSEAMVGCLKDPTDESMKARLEALAWLVAQGRLDIKVVLPRGADGYPMAANDCRDYYHPKEMVFEDAEGNLLGTTGSNNESQNGWEHHYETFSVYTSWMRGDATEPIYPMVPYIRQIEFRMKALWEGTDPGWIAMDIPEAAKAKLLKFTPKSAPFHDPFERVQPAPLPVPMATGATPRERLLFQFLREAPRLPNGHLLGLETAAITPWPHQRAVMKKVVDAWPQSFLLCDEVGLGKTIEAGLALRQLLLSGNVKRALLLVPKAVMRQWQEELHEKFALHIPRYQAGKVLDIHNQPIPFSGPVWDAFPLLLASSQLVKRRENHLELLTAKPWDLILVDEAHHARRKDFNDGTPNRLLELLRGREGRPGLKSRTQAIYLMTATPMQVHPVEVWDLLRLLGMGGEWGSEQRFNHFFNQLQVSVNDPDRDWDFLLDMVQDHLLLGGEILPRFRQSVESTLNVVEAATVLNLPAQKARKGTISHLSAEARTLLDRLIAWHTPLRRFMCRNTRELLRKYHEQGLLKAHVPDRIPQNIWVNLVGAERDLYERIENYITEFYKLLEGQAKGKGFIMTVYRRRLTSSFDALKKSLEKRLAKLEGQQAALLDDDDVDASDDYIPAIAQELDLEELAEQGEVLQTEIDYLRDFIQAIKQLPGDSKFERLQAELQNIFLARNKVIVFTQFTDTMDSLRERLRLVYGKSVACYSGRGGERYDGVGWIPVDKEEVKRAFREKEDIKILLCTESASEGLNLQTCGDLINFDMPWNPMRVEQRIGRIDRIGQVFRQVHIKNFFFEDTVEADVYRALEQRIGSFVLVVGRIQPILHRVEATIERLAMSSPDDRKARLKKELKDLDDQWAQGDGGLDLAQTLAEVPEAPTLDPPPLTMADLERVLTKESTLATAFVADQGLPGAWILTWGGKTHRVTFNPKLYDEHPTKLSFLTFGTELLDALLASVPTPDPGGPGEGYCLATRGGEESVSALFANRESGITLIQELKTLEGHLDAPGTSGPTAAEVETIFKPIAERAIIHRKMVRAWDRDAQIKALKRVAIDTVLTAARIAAALASQGYMLDGPFHARYGKDALEGLKEFEGGVYYKGLIIKLQNDAPLLDSHDVVLHELKGRTRQSLLGLQRSVGEKAQAILMEWVKVQKEATEDVAATPGVTLTWFTKPTVAAVIPFLEADQVHPFENALPLLDLEAAAGGFGEEQPLSTELDQLAQNPSGATWVTLPVNLKPSKRLFVVKVVGESMNRRIPNGALAVFRAEPQGTRQGKVVLARLNSDMDPEMGGRFTVKVYESTKVDASDGTWNHQEVRLRPDSHDPTFQPIVLNQEGGTPDVAILAEFVQVVD